VFKVSDGAPSLTTISGTNYSVRETEKTKQHNMNKTLAILGSIVAVAVLVGLMYVSYSNSEKRLRNAITAKQTDNRSELDNLQKKISQNAQVTEAQMQLIKDVVIGNSEARAQKNGGTLATFVREAVPNVDTKTSTQLMNIITSSRDSFTQRQKEILDLKREHDNIVDTFPGSLFVGGRPKIDVVVVTSTRAEESFRTGKDDDVNVFSKKN
jgi:hypothetical protein